MKLPLVTCSERPGQPAAVHPGNGAGVEAGCWQEQAGDAKLL